MPVEWTTANIPLATGQQQKADPRALEAPAMAVCKNAQFDDVGGTQPRKPFANMGGGPPSALRRLAVYDGSLICFTKDEIYQYSAASGGSWKKAADHVAVRVWEDDVNVKTYDQVEHERAVLDGVAVYAWNDGSSLHYVALDDATGAVIAGPTSNSGYKMPRLIALADRIAMFAIDGSSGLYYKVLLPSNINSSTAHEGITGSFTSIATLTTDQYDVRRVPTTDKATLVYHYTSGYKIQTFTGGSSGAPTLASAVSKARVVNRLAVATLPAGKTVVIRMNDDPTNTVLADLLEVADTYTDTAFLSVDLGEAAVDDTSAQVTCCWRSVAESDGSYVCRAFWTTQEIPSNNTNHLKTNTIDTAGSAGTVKQVIAGSGGVASHAFDYDGDVHVWISHCLENDVAGGHSTSLGYEYALFNRITLMREDYVLAAKALNFRAEGYATNITDGWLPTVQLVEGTKKFAFGQSWRREIALGDDKSDAYAERSPVVVSFEMDSNDARRNVQLGKTLYVASGPCGLSQFDGTALVEVGFSNPPQYIANQAATVAGNLEAGDYVWTASYSYTNGKGEFERSGRAIFAKATVAASKQQENHYGFLSQTAKRSDLWNGRSDISVEAWRTKKNPGDAASFYLVTGIDPLTTTGDNCYIANNATIRRTATDHDDNFADSTLETKEAYPSEELEVSSPPTASIVISGDERLIVAGIPGEPYTLQYSKYRQRGYLAHFARTLRVIVPFDSGEVTGAAFLNETLVAFCERGTYMLPGDGYDDTGGGQNYGPARLLSVDVGCETADSVAVIPNGVIFRSKKGWHILNRGWTMTYIGAPVADYDDDTVIAVHVLADQHQVRIVSEERVLVWDLITEQWSEWPEADNVGSAIWKGKHVLAKSDDTIVIQSDEYVDCDGALDLETAWLKPDGLAGFVRAKELLLTGEYRSEHRLRIRVAYDYATNEDGVIWTDDRYWTATPEVVGGPLRCLHRFSQQKCSSFKVRITTYHKTADQPPPGEACKLTGMAIKYGRKGGLGRLPADQKQ